MAETEKYLKRIIYTLIIGVFISCLFTPYKILEKFIRGKFLNLKIY